MEDLQLFLEGEQGLLGISLKDCEALINRFESSEEAKNNKQLLIDGFTQLLMSKESDVFNSSKEAICQDMKQPLAHYFISTYHNT
jgi:inactive phospholipase C-like protein 1